MYTYLLINLCSVSVPLWRSFDSRIALQKKWKFLFPAILISAGVFLGWDIVFTNLGIWGFNHRYVCGIFIAGLPIEEWLFFICIPYACIFSYEALRYFIPKDYLASISTYITIALSLTLGILGILNTERAYTATTFISFAVFLLVLQFYFKAAYLGRYYQTYVFLLIPFLIVNGILTGTGLEEPVVWYNNTENIGIRIGTIPVEDIFYGMFLILMILSLFEWFQQRALRKVQPDKGTIEPSGASL